MEYIIFGDGTTALTALHFLGYERVGFFVDEILENDLEYEGKRVHHFQYYLEYKKENLLVLASDKNMDRMKKIVSEKGIKKYFVFDERIVLESNKYFPLYMLYNKNFIMSCTEFFSNTNIYKYKKIAIIGFDFNLPYIISELCFQNRYENILCIVPILKNEKREYPEEVCGIKVCSLEEALYMAECFVICERRCQDNEIREKLYKLKNKIVLDLFDAYKYISLYKHPSLNKFRNLYKGKRIFLIGNGPSLSINDLDRLYENHEICFGFNKIYHLYSRTKWRADYIGFTDHTIMQSTLDENLIGDLDATIFWSDNLGIWEPQNKNWEFFHMEFEEFYPNYPRFSEDISCCTYKGGSAIYDIGMQMAAFMGASEIIILGVDHNYTSDVTNINNHFDGYKFSEAEVERLSQMTPQIEVVTKAFEKAERYSREHNFRIYNATRGGKLEVFERVDFNSLFE